MARILIATPTAGGNAPIAYSQSLMAAAAAIHAMGGSYRYLSIDGASVVLARNVLTQAFLQDKSCDYILFIDSDMAISDTVFTRFLQAKRPMIGAIYSKRAIDLTRYADALQADPDDRRARAIASDFNVVLSPGETPVIDNLMEVTAFGFGCVLIHRNVFEALIARGQIQSMDPRNHKKISGLGPIHDFFGEISLETGEHISEDYAFCLRVRALGDIPVLGYVGDGVGHVGSFTYSGPFIEKLKSEKTD